MKIQFFAILILLGLVVNAQDFQGKATYKTHRKFKMNLGGDRQKGQGINTEMQAKIRAQMMKQFQRTFTLSFTKNESVYKQNEELEAPQVQTSGMQIQVSVSGGGTDVYYKNTAEKRYVNKTEISGKRFLIKDNLEQPKWEMSGETKNIGNYTCYKATQKREEIRTSFLMTDGEREEKKEKVTVETVAWYTPEIPVSNGPERFWGLPGLILEIQDGDQTIVCSEIVLNPKEKIEIKEPKKGKKVSQEEYGEIMKKHSEDMMKRFTNQRGSGGTMIFESR